MNYKTHAWQHSTKYISNSITVWWGKRAHVEWCWRFIKDSVWFLASHIIKCVAQLQLKHKLLPYEYVKCRVERKAFGRRAPIVFQSKGFGVLYIRRWCSAYLGFHDCLSYCCLSVVFFIFTLTSGIKRRTAVHWTLFCLQISSKFNS